MDKDYCLSIVRPTEQKKLTPIETRKQIEHIVHQRKEKTDRLWLLEEYQKRKNS